MTVYVPITMEFVVLVLQKCFELSMMKVVLLCSQSTHRNFNQMAIKLQSSSKWPKSNKSYSDYTLKFNQNRDRKKIIFFCRVCSRLNNMSGTDSKVFSGFRSIYTTVCEFICSKSYIEK